MKDKIGYIKPQKVFGNIYFVGIREASTHIIDTGEGLILIDPGMPETVGVVIDNIKELGFDVKDIKIILISHLRATHHARLGKRQRRGIGRRIGHVHVGD